MVSPACRGALQLSGLFINGAIYSETCFLQVSLYTQAPGFGQAPFLLEVLHVSATYPIDVRFRLVLAILVVFVTLALGVLSLFYTPAFAVFSAMVAPMSMALRYYFAPQKS